MVWMYWWSALAAVSFVFTMGLLLGGLFTVLVVNPIPGGSD